ncbi:MAG: hypothetical protein ACP5IK_03260 [Candidatus Micrarchaeia archaeon]
MQHYLERANPVAYVCESESVEESIKAADRLSGRRNFVLLLSKGIDPAKLLPAYLNAAVRKHSGMGKASKPSMEMLLYVAGTPNIKEAIKKCGAHEQKFIAFSTSHSLFRKFKKQSRIRVIKQVPISFDGSEAEKVFASIKD